MHIAISCLSFDGHFDFTFLASNRIAYLSCQCTHIFASDLKSIKYVLYQFNEDDLRFILLVTAIQFNSVATS